MAGATTLIQVELDILLRSIARELRVDVEALPLELEIVAKMALRAAFAKGEAAGVAAARTRRHLQIVRDAETRRERSERPTMLPPPAVPPAPGEGDAGVYMFVDRDRTTRPPPRSPRRLIEDGGEREEPSRGDEDEDPEP